MTPAAIKKVINILKNQGLPFSYLRISVTGGGCSGFTYSMTFTNETNLLDKIYKFETTIPDGENQSLTLIVDQASLLYLDSVEIDYLETLEASGFKFNNPNTKSTCGCGSSFST